MGTSESRTFRCLLLRPRREKGVLSSFRMLGDIINRLRRLSGGTASLETSQFYRTLQQRWWDHATAGERERLRDIYFRLFSIREDLIEEVRLAQIIEILECYDHKSWPDHYQLKGVTNKLQETVTLHYESQAIDQIQRSNYFILARGGQGRHNDVAYGLSGKLKWSQREQVTNSLLEMGRREYHEPIPTSHEKENGVLHVAVSYRHSSRFDRGGTLTRTQANAIWTAVRDIPLMTEDTQVRVWLDQNLHRRKFPPGKWHEYGLLPYACLQTVYIGTGDFSLKHAYRRPWLWVEMITGLKTSGIRTKRGHDVLQDCNNVLMKRHRFAQQRQRFIDFGCVFGVSWNVDRVMDDITRTISLWRRSDFLGHATYEYAEDFENFVNWARRFVIRSIKYSEMSWNHSSESVKGMNTVVLIRALPSAMGRADADSSVLLPTVSWQTGNPRGCWTVDDVIDRSGIGELPLSTITETNEASTADCSTCVIEDQHLDLGGVQLRRIGRTVSLVLENTNASSLRKPSRYGRMFHTIRSLSGTSSLITLSIPESYGTLLTYQTFTQRYATLNGYSRIPAKDEILNPLQVDVPLTQQLGLQALGVAYNVGVCEQVYTVDVDHEQWPVSTLEVYLIMGACNGNVLRFKAILRTLKENLSYKEMGFKDLSDFDKTQLCRGWPIGRDLKELNNKRIVSGEMKLDIEEEMIELLREKYSGRAIVWVDSFDSSRVQFTFRRRQFIVRCLSPRLYAEHAIAIVEGDQWSEFVNAGYTGPLQMVAGLQPLFKVQDFGSGLNPLLKKNFSYDGAELKIFMVPGLFVKCARCSKQVCPVNGLTADVFFANASYHVRWKEPHGCLHPEYVPFQVHKHVRIA